VTVEQTLILPVLMVHRDGSNASHGTADKSGTGANGETF
jgi:hypothetical protein